MDNLEVFTENDLGNNVGQLIKDAEKGCLSVITKQGAPVILAVPFDSQLLKLGLNRSIALYLFEKEIVTLAQASQIARLSMYEFLEVLRETDIDVVDYPVDEIETDIANIL